MEKKFISEKGFVYFELLMTLFIVSLLFSLTIPSFQSLSSHFEIENWIEQFTADYYWAQQEAVDSDQWVEILFKPAFYSYEIRNGNGSLKKVYYDSSIKVTENLLNHRIMFNGFGQLAQQSGTITVKNATITKKIVIQLLTGQIHVES